MCWMVSRILTEFGFPNPQLSQAPRKSETTLFTGVFVFYRRFWPSTILSTETFALATFSSTRRSCWRFATLDWREIFTLTIFTSWRVNSVCLSNGCRRRPCISDSLVWKVTCEFSAGWEVVSLECLRYPLGHFWNYVVIWTRHMHHRWHDIVTWCSRLSVSILFCTELGFKKSWLPWVN